MHSNSRSRHSWQCFTLACATLSLVAACFGPSVQLWADDAANKPAAQPSASEDLTRRQERIASKYAQLEELMLRMAQLEAAQNPRRAALLNQALGKSKESHTKLQLDTIASLLGKRQLSRAVKEQASAEKSLEELLKLLQSEDRSERLKTEQERVKEYIKEVERMIRIQRSIQGQNEGGGDAKRIAEEQNKLAERAEDLSNKIKENEEGSPQSQDEAAKPEGEKPSQDAETEPSDSQGKSGEKKSSESKSGDKPTPGDQNSQKNGPNQEQKPANGQGEKKPGEQGKPSDAQEQQPNAEQKPGDQPSNDGDTKPGDMKPGEQKPSEGQPPESKPSESKPSENNTPPQPGEQQPGSQSEPAPSGDQQQQPKQENPVRKKIDEAQQRMKAAEQKLQDAKRKESVEEQQKAREELEKAKAELEKILKQLREEEMERTLQALEGRFRKMLEMQVKVYEGTKKLDAIPSDERTRELDVQAGRLGGDEAKIAVEAEKALQLLEEEGSSVAFPATVDLLVDDMRQTADRLNQGKVDSITQGLEEEIIASLEELLQALEQAQQKLEEQKQQPQQPPPQQQGQQEQPLVDAIQELKMIKSLQLRVNKRTDRYAKLLQAEDDPVGQANTQELLDALDKLGERQKQVFEIVREIVLGRNK